MRRLIILVVLAAVCLSMSGCWFFDAEHNRVYWDNVKHDFRLLHQDLDFIMMWDRQSPNDAYYR